MLDGEDEYYKSLSPVDSIPEEDSSAHPFFFSLSSKGASFAQPWAVRPAPAPPLPGPGEGKNCRGNSLMVI